MCNVLNPWLLLVLAPPLWASAAAHIRPNDCRFKGLYVMLDDLEGGEIVFEENKGWQVSSSPNDKHIYCDVFLDPERQCNLTEFDVGFSTTANICSNTTAKYSPVLDQNGMFRVEPLFAEQGRYYLCLFDRTSGGLGYPVLESPFLVIDVLFVAETFSLPIWLFVVLVIGLQLGAGMCSGLNLGLLSLDLSDLRILMEAGNVKERRYAKIVYHLRSKGNALLVAIVLSNSAFNAVNTVILESKLKGMGAAIASTIMITIFGEVVPQAVFSRFSLAVGAITSWITRTLLFVTFPFSWPVGKLLDRILGKEPPSSYPREKVQILLKEQIPGVKECETEMISGILGLETKCVKDYMKKIDDVFMLNSDRIYDESLHMQICESGYSRVPVFITNRSNVIGVIHIKDLSLFGEYGRHTVGAVCEKFNLPFVRCQAETNMNELLFNLKERGKRGKAHMVIVENEDQNAIGIITMEDIMEEMLSFDILDEFDKSDEEKKKRFAGRNVLGTYGRSGLSPQIRNSALRLMATLEPFNESHISSDSLNRLIEQCYRVTAKGSKTVFYRRKVPADFFVLLVKGKAVLEIGEEKLKFDAPPFSHYGLNALQMSQSKESIRKLARTQQPLYFPEFSLYSTESVGYIKVDRVQWINACMSPLLRNPSLPQKTELKK